MKKYIGWGPVSLALSFAFLISGLTSGGDIDGVAITMSILGLLSFIFAILSIFKESRLKKYIALFSIAFLIIVICLFSTFIITNFH